MTPQYVYPATTNVAALTIIAVVIIATSSTYNFFSPFIFLIDKDRKKVYLNFS